jgi:hypothetical protein
VTISSVSKSETTYTTRQCAYKLVQQLFHRSYNIITNKTVRMIWFIHLYVFHYGLLFNLFFFFWGGVKLPSTDSIRMEGKERFSRFRWKLIIGTSNNKVPFAWSGKDSRRVWPVNSRCLLVNKSCLPFQGNWSHLWYIRRSVFAPLSDLYFLQDLWDCIWNTSPFALRRRGVPVGEIGDCSLRLPFYQRENWKWFIWEDINHELFLTLTLTHLYR